MYQPANGDTVTVTRTMPGGRTWSCTGVLSSVRTAADSPPGRGGFHINGTDCQGQPHNSSMSDADGLKQYGVTQTITLVSPKDTDR